MRSVHFPTSHSTHDALHSHCFISAPHRRAWYAPTVLSPASRFDISSAEISITGPSSSEYWVQNTSNTITWTFQQGDPNPISIIVTNTQNTTLNGAFSIQEFVDASNQSFTVTNVTLRPGDNYQVVFVNSTNPSQVYANSSDFSVKPAGTAPAPTSSSSSSGTAASSGSPSNPSSSGASSSTSAPAASQSANAAVNMFASVRGLAYAVGACSLASLGAFFL
ncbi:hypothetical protein OF83DRAFT_1109937 [Amylostereum chailletii]|nr:hypothetical protein OF83DRAFT_1109937 [Amylostereum chailletii]